MTTEQQQAGEWVAGEAAAHKLAVYPGTFDPITMGHLDIINRGLEIFDRVVIAVAVHPAKTPLFSLEERLQMIRSCFPADEQRLEVEAVQGLLVNYAAQKGATAIIRGLRAVSDFDYEFQLALMNRRLQREVETVFLMTGFRWIFISSSIIKDAARHGGDVSGLVPDHVQECLRAKFARG
ncbi:MAG: pantetheine-phosphate adenylyltransferase [Deltaproteobacteria bacterium RIFOXYD12_FULL_57_12]|nr:MAG: pantetheine-phosphate adenylyltransferase [Deltaproteobacteria bacterium RIFOXYD12_FULL_57_12]